MPNEPETQVIEAASLEEPYQSRFKLPWVLQWPDGFTMEFQTEEQACYAQRVLEG